MLQLPTEPATVPGGTRQTGTGAHKSQHCFRKGDPAAAQLLYALYADQIRTYLRRHTGFNDVEDAVFDVLIEVVRSARELGSSTIEPFSQTVRDLSQQGAFALRRTRNAQTSSPGCAAERNTELVNDLFTVLDCSERAILLRSLSLSEHDEEISTELAVPVLQIRRARAKARILFRVSAHFGPQYAAAASA